jgi:hypothetical protein
MGEAPTGKQGRFMNALGRPSIEQLRDDLELRSTRIDGKMLCGYLPDGAAMECTMSETSCCVARRVITAPVQVSQPMIGLEWLVDRLNRRGEGLRWEVRRRQRPSTVEVWVAAVADGTDSDEATRTVRNVMERLAGAARRLRPPMTAICQPRVAEILRKCFGPYVWGRVVSETRKQGDLT